jgi:hypothetical protein
MAQSDFNDGDYAGIDHRPPLVLRVGISGHRSLEDPGQWQSLRRRTRDVLVAIQNAVRNAAATPGAYSGAPAVIRATSPLAEGADRLFAQEALTLKFELQCPLPFDRQEYCNDFLDANGPHPPSVPQEVGSNPPKNSIEEFEELLGAAIAVLEFDGPTVSEKRGSAYTMAGRAVVDHSDLLVVIWDGKSPRGSGGTGEIKQLALERNKPVIWLKVESDGAGQGSHSKHDDRLFWPKNVWPKNADPDQSLNSQSIQKVVDWLLLPPWIRNPHPQAEADPLAAYAVRSPGFGMLDRSWQLFTRIMGGSGPMATVPSVDPSLQLPDPFQSQYDLVNEPAKRLAGSYRGAFLLIYIAGLAAVWFALLEGAKPCKWIWVPCELAAITFALVLVFFVRRRRWHYRAVDCRYLAEQLRILRYIYPLGLTALVPQLPAHQLHGDLSASWMQWRLMAIVRSVPLPNQRFEQVFLRRCYRAITEDWIRGQISYHHHNARRLELIEKWLHRLAWFFLWAAAIACVLHFWAHGPCVPWLTLFAAGFPAASAACQGISNQGEFRRLVMRSEAMAASLENASTELESMAGKLSAEVLQRKAAEAGQIMLAEVVDWQILYRKPIEAA